MTERERFIISACEKIGTPYIWGCKSGDPGLDCSGLVQLMLQFYGMDPPGDQSAAAYFDYFDARKARPLTQGELCDLGDIIFYGHDGGIHHIAMALSPFKIIEAGGGDQTTLTVEIAAHQKAQTRIKPIDHRQPEIQRIVRPIGYPWTPDISLVSG